MDANVKLGVKAIIVGSAVIIVTPLAGTIVPAIWAIPGVNISVGTLLSAGVIAGISYWATGKYIN